MKITIQTSASIEFEVTDVDGESLDTIKMQNRMPEPREFEIGKDIKTGYERELKSIALFYAVDAAAEYIGIETPYEWRTIKRMCGESGSFCVEDMVGTPFDFSILNVFVTGTVYRILRMAARGRVHIYGLSDKEFYDRMSKTRDHYNKTQSQQLLKLFKEGLITTKAKI